jgi:alpha-L-fucosidase 2
MNKFDRRSFLRASAAVAVGTQRVLARPQHSPTNLPPGPNAGLHKDATVQDLALWYDKPAADWNEALPIGNGRLAAMAFGGVAEELLRINENTFWAGGPHDYTNPEAGPHLDELRGMIFHRQFQEAQKLATEKLMGNPPLQQPYQPFCDLRLLFAGQEGVSDYRRELDLDRALATVAYRSGGVQFRREIFASYPDQVLVVGLTADRPGLLNFDVLLSSQEPGVQVVASGDDALHLSGEVGPRERALKDAHGRGNWNAGWDGPGLKFQALLHVGLEGGKVSAREGNLEVRGAQAATLLFSAATSFNNYHDISGDAAARAEAHIKPAAAKSYQKILRDHVADYQRYFRRVRLDLGTSAAPSKPTDVRLKSFRDAPDPQLATLLYQFGRYLVITSSRPGGQPPNLQGMWNQDIWPTWGSKYTTNINLQMNYWPVETGNLSELHEPLFDLVDDLRVTGAAVAKSHYHASGFVLHHNTDLWRGAAPVDGPWGLWPVGGVWLAEHFWTHYEFTEDQEFLRRRAYPTLKDAAQFILDFLMEAPPGVPFAGYLVTNPSTSPENSFRVADHVNSSLTYAATIDLELILDLFDHCAQASRILGVDPEFRARLGAAGRRLPPLQIGRRGQLQEWIEDYDEPEPHHRHTSHLYALYPGARITSEGTPELAAAARKSLELRGEAGTGWARAWRTALWARLKDGNRAYQELGDLAIKQILPDLFSDCPPMQVDGAYGVAAAITEMLLQSHAGVIQLLPALPDAWPAGSITGLRARGGIGIDMEWRDGKLMRAVLASPTDKSCQVRYHDKQIRVALRGSVASHLNGDLVEQK